MESLVVVSDREDSQLDGTRWTDRMGMLASIGCAIHCAAMPFVIGYLPSLGLTWMAGEGFHRWMANLALGHRADPRDYGVGIQILKDLGITKVRLMTNNPKKTDAFVYGGFDLQVIDQIPVVPPANEHNAEYLATKRDKMGHELPSSDLEVGKH